MVKPCAKRTFNISKEVERKWLDYEQLSDACFTRMANNALEEYLDKKLRGNTKLQ